MIVILVVVVVVVVRTLKVFNQMSYLSFNHQRLNHPLQHNPRTIYVSLMITQHKLVICYERAYTFFEWFIVVCFFQTTLSKCNLLNLTQRKRFILRD